MRHYEIVFLIHPDRGDQVQTLIEQYKTMITTGRGKIHREENWGLRKLEYPVKKAHKAYYYLINIEVNQETLHELKSHFAYNDTILRYLATNCDRAVSEPSPMMRNKDRYHTQNREELVSNNDNHDNASASDNIHSDNNEDTSS